MVHYIGKPRHNSILECKVADQIKIHLPYIPGTGYVWEMDLLEGPLIEESNDSIQVEDSAIGSSVVHEFCLRAEAKGLASLYIKHYRSWQGDASIIDEFRLEVRVN